MEIDECDNDQNKLLTSATERNKQMKPREIKTKWERWNHNNTYLLNGRAGEVEIECENDATISLIDLKANIIRDHVSSDQVVVEKRASLYKVERS